MQEQLGYQILSIIVSIVGILLTYYIVPYLKNKIGTEKMNQMMIWIKAAVAAAEMIYPEFKSGEKKKEYVVEFLKNKGVTITDQELNALIEAVVYELNRANNLLNKDLSLGDQA